MLRSENIAIDGYSPTLIPSYFYIAIQPVDNWSKFGTEEENVDAAKGRDFIEKFRDGLLKQTFSDVAN